MSERELHIAARRLELLRALAQLGGEENGTALLRILRAAYRTLAHDEFESDLAHLRRQGCISERWAGTLRIVDLTERGTDAAHGRVAVEGVLHERWRDAPHD